LIVLCIEVIIWHELTMQISNLLGKRYIKLILLFLILEQGQTFMELDITISIDFA
jgi:hypothetical protein